MDLVKRCPWCESSQRYRDYHDLEWGRPVFDEQHMFECLILETFQAGLSWITVLNKREAFREVFHRFNIEQVAAMSEPEVKGALNNAGIIRHEGKIRAAIQNAQATLHMQSEGGTLVHYFWSHVDGTPVVNRPNTLHEVPAVNPLAAQLSKDLKKRGFKFVGPTTMYSFLQATGIVNDHLEDCHVKYSEEESKA